MMRRLFVLVLLLASGMAIAEGAFTTTVEDQTAVAVTVYNNNRALVRDQREIALGEGEVALKFMDVAALIMPETVSIQSLSAPGKLSILEQNYEYDLMSQAKLMEKYVGKEVCLINKNADYSFTEIEATLLSTGKPQKTPEQLIEEQIRRRGYGGYGGLSAIPVESKSEAIYEIDGDIYLGHPGTVVLPELPEELIAKPTLIWLLNNHMEKQEVEVTYLTGGLSWKADYVLSLNEDSSVLDLEGWVTLNNQSGASYQDAKLKLVAGSVNIVQDVHLPSISWQATASMVADSGMREEPFSEYHLYTLPRATTIKQNQTKQVRLLSAKGVQLEKSYEYKGYGHYHIDQHPPERFAREKVDVMLSFNNKATNQLGMPLPGGIMRIYQEDSEGSLQFAGEDKVEHTPKDEEVKLKLGQAFDIAVERVQTDFKKLSRTEFESAYSIKIRNHKEEDVRIEVVELMPNDWEILESSMDYEKRTALCAVFQMDAPKDEEVEVHYRVRVKR